MSAAIIPLRRSPKITRVKRFETLRAQFALQGVELHKTETDHGDESYLLTVGRLTLDVQNLDDAEEYLGACSE
jgi:hypothetical protein